MEKPNIVWICTDQQRFDTLGCYGNRYVRTPNIDKLAQNGVVFDHAYAQSTVCTPSRSSFLTGRYPRTTCCRQNGQSIPDRELLITKIFAQSGYFCGLSGKLHLSACSPAHCTTMERRIEDGYHVFNWSHSHKPKWPGNQYHTWLKSKNVEYRTEKLKETDHVEYGMPAEYHQTTWCINKAINFIDNCSGHGRPWFFSINIFDPHAPFDPPKSHIDRYLDMLDQIPLPNYSKGELESKPAIQMLEHREGINSSPIKRYRTAEMTESDHKFIKAAYWAMIDLVDEQVGRLYAFLEGKNLLENTLFIFMSDHGELLGDHGMYYKGPFFYEPSVRVPLIVSWPSRIPPGRRSGALVELVDLAPTLLEAAGMPESPGMQGKSFWDLLTGKKEPGFHKKNVYCEYYNSLPWNKPHAYGTMLRDDRNKIVVNHGSDLGELYDLEADPGERTNLWDKAAFKDRKLRMMKDLCDRMAWTADPLPIRDAAF